MLKQINNLPIPYVSTDISDTELNLDINTFNNHIEKSTIGNSLTLNLRNDPITATSSVLEQVSSATSATSSAIPDVEYEQFLADVWVGVVLTLMVLSCVCCMCSCLLYHKFQQWKRSVLEARARADLESASYDVDILPSYTIASGLPNYEEALSQLKTAKECCKIHNHCNNLENRRKSLLAQLQNPQEKIDWLSSTSPAPTTSLTITDLFQIYRRNSLNTAGQEGTKIEL